MKSRLGRIQDKIAAETAQREVAASKQVPRIQQNLTKQLRSIQNNEAKADLFVRDLIEDEQVTRTINLKGLFLNSSFLDEDLIRTLPALQEFENEMGVTTESVDIYTPMVGRNPIISHSYSSFLGSLVGGLPAFTAGSIYIFSTAHDVGYAAMSIPFTAGFAGAALVGGFANAVTPREEITLNFVADNTTPQWLEDIVAPVRNGLKP